MKTSHPAAVPAALALTLAASIAMSPALRAQTDPSIPVGNLDAFPTIVQTGTHPTLTWDIEYPSTTDEVIIIDPPGTVIPIENTCVTARIVGTSVKRVWLNKWGQVTKWDWVPAEAWMKIDNGSWNRLFFGDLNDVKPNKKVYSAPIQAGQEINFGARYYVDGQYSTFFSSENSSQNVIALVKGDTPPTKQPLYQQPDLMSFLEPYLDHEGKIDIGPLDVIYVMELTHTDWDHGGFDLQDMVVLLSFGCKNNNGHGNNEDGVDVSNPGQGGGGPNGEDDPSGNVDDETKGKWK